jgi:FkbM family methyltransferase
MPSYHEWRTPQGDFWIPRDDDAILPILLAQQAVRFYGDSETGVHRGDIVLDCGAHIGVYVRTALNAGAALVVAIEPAPENLACLRRNFAEEVTSGRVIVVPKGVWDCEATLKLHLNRNSAGDSFVLRGAGDTGTIDAPLTTVDHLVSDLRLSRVDFIKMDIKGAEKQALAGAAGTLRRYRPRLAVAAEHEPGDAAAITAIVRKAHADYSARTRIAYFAGWRIQPEVLIIH